MSSAEALKLYEELHRLYELAEKGVPAGSRGYRFVDADLADILDGRGGGKLSRARPPDMQPDRACGKLRPGVDGVPFEDPLDVGLAIFAPSRRAGCHQAVRRSVRS